jgi:pimeloyl-ACP methyl ester carboxylesterase
MKRRSEAAAKRRRKVRFEALEPRILLSADLSYTAAAGTAADLTLRLQNVENIDTLQLIDNSDQSVLQSQALADTSAVKITGAEQDDRLIIDFSTPFSVPDGILFTDAFEGDSDTLQVTGKSNMWNITGDDSGTVASVDFSGIENLTGGNAADTFIFDDNGSITGAIDGSAGDDTLDYSDYTAWADVNLTAETATATNGVSNIENVIGEDDPLLFIHGFGGSMQAAGQSMDDWLTHRGYDPELLALDPLMNTYDDLIQSLENVGYRTEADVDGPQTLYVANWDWRMPVAEKDATLDGHLDIDAFSITDGVWETGLDYLGYWLEDVSDDWYDATGVRPESVDIIAHSTGGVLARSYIQSNAHGGEFDTDAYLPTVNDLVMVGAPSEGAPEVWNLLHNNFGLSDSTRLMGLLLSSAYDKVQDGETIYGPDCNISDSGISEEEFIKSYVGSLEDPLRTCFQPMNSSTWTGI